MRLITILALAFLATPVLAQDASKELGEGGRYALERTGNAVMRVDRRTGVVSRCTERDGRWSCATVAEEREALEAEIGRLADENAKLKGRVAALEGRGETAKDKPSLPLPSREDMDRAVGFIENIMQRIAAVVQWLQREFAGNDAPGRSGA